LNSQNEFSLSGLTELEDNILPFWLSYAQALYPSVIRANGSVESVWPKSTLLLCRLLWSFSASYRVTKRASYLTAATELFDFLYKHLFDGSFGPLKSTFTENDVLCNVGKIPEEKASFICNTLVQSYAIYSFSEYFFVSNNSSAKHWADTLFLTLESSALTSVGVYVPDFDKSTSVTSLNVSCDSRVQLHVLEAYVNLYKTTGNVCVLTAIKQLLTLFTSKILDEKTPYFILYFDAMWRQSSYQISFGHNVESAWLLVDSANLFDDKKTQKIVADNLIYMLNSTLSMQPKRNVGVINGIDELGEYQTEKKWWVQAETLNCLLSAAKINDNNNYKKQVLYFWDFILLRFKDSLLGEWHTQLNMHLAPMKECNKVDEWRCPYHSVRACLFVSNMLNDYN